MGKKRFWVITICLIATAFFINIYCGNAAQVEEGYTIHLYKYISGLLRILFGWLPISIGDILYGIAVLWLLCKSIKFITALIKRKITRQIIFIFIKNSTIFMLVLYIVFNVFWGINYNREGIATQLHLKIDTVSYADLKTVTTLLIEKLNTTKKYLINNKIDYPTNKALFKKVKLAYEKTSQVYPFLAYNPVSIKPSMWGWLGNYMGFTGYYNPFTGEAQLNTTVPKFLHPFIACHEVAHQLGYAKEDEANSVGYLAALHSGDSLLLYATYFDLYNYTFRQLLFKAYKNNDTVSAKQLSQLLIPEVKQDIKELFYFYKNHQNPIEPFIRMGYGFYLKKNNQPNGLQSYDDVTGFLIAYYKKFGTI